MYASFCFFLRQVSLVGDVWGESEEGDMFPLGLGEAGGGGVFPLSLGEAGGDEDDYVFPGELPASLQVLEHDCIEVKEGFSSCYCPTTNSI